MVIEMKTVKQTQNTYYLKTVDNLVPDYWLKSVGNPERPHGIIYWYYLKTASFKNGDTLKVMHQGRNVICSPIFEHIKNETC
jgi:hypothetical protein